jgi:nifR3 family TIM-barrel protein
VPPHHYYIRDIRIEPNLVLAPMEGVTDLTFRRLVRQIGGTGLTVTEFIPSEGLRRGSARMEQMARIDPDEHPVAIQIYGRDPEAMAEAARIIQDTGADICDINMGCPSKKVCAHSGGSALLKDVDLATQIVRAVRAAITIPLTVKMRSGFDSTQRNAPEVAWMCQEEGVEAITIHWRTRADLYSGTRAVDKIAETKAKLRIPVVGNGDIVDHASAMRMFEDTGCDGVMVGRGAIKNPWVFQQVWREMNGEAPLVVDAEEKRRVLLGYFASLRSEFKNDRGALGRMKKIANYFTAGLPFASDLRFAILHSESPDSAIAEVNQFFDALAERRARRLQDELAPSDDAERGGVEVGGAVELAP